MGELIIGRDGVLGIFVMLSELGASEGEQENESGREDSEEGRSNCDKGLKIVNMLFSMDKIYFAWEERTDNKRVNLYDSASAVIIIKGWAESMRKRPTTTGRDAHQLKVSRTPWP